MATTRNKSRRIVKEDYISKTGVTLDKCFCRKCMSFKKPLDFFDATDTFLDSNGKMSICKDCINSAYKGIFINEQSLERTLLRLCRILNCRFDLRAVAAAQKHLDTIASKGQETENIFGLYKNKILSVESGKLSDKDWNSQDLSFTEPSLELKSQLPAGFVENKEYFENQWGKSLNLNQDDYEYLEQQFGEWKRTTKCDTQGELVLVKEICYKQNEIRKARIEGHSVDAMVKSLQDIMKNSALTPALQTAAQSGKNADTFGNWIKDIEQFSPADYYADKEKFKDIDGIGAYIEKYITRPIGNFITGSRDFSTDDLEEINDPDNDELDSVKEDG
jgi:hypothetical protein